MSDQHRNCAFDSLLERLAIDQLAEREWQELASRITQDDQALRGYVEAVHWRQSLGYLVGRGAASDQAARRLMEDSSGEDPRAASAISGTARDEPPAAMRSHLSSTRRWRDWLGAWVLAASVAFVAGAGVTAALLRHSPDLQQSNSAEPLRERPTLATVDPAVGRPPSRLPAATFVQESQLGKVSGLSPEASAEGLLRSLQVGQELRCGEVVQLTTGFMRILLHSGPELIVEAPAEFSIIGKESVFVRVGRVSASGAEKLLLQSPLLMAECSDASVSFVAEEDAVTNVYVYYGVVTMRSNEQPDSASSKLRLLHEGEGVRVSPSGKGAELQQVAAAPPEGGVRNWTEVEAKLSDYERLVLSDRPVAYWPLYRVRRNRRVLDLTQHGFDGQAIGNWPTELNDAAASDERGAFFNGESYIEPDHKPPLDVRTGFAVEGWAKVHGDPAYQSIFTSRWVLDAGTPRLQCLGFTLYAGSNDRWQLWTGSGRYGELWKELHADIPVVRYRWTHVVATFEADEPLDGRPVEAVKGVVRLYIDGQFAATEVHVMSLLDFEWPARIGAAEFVPNSLTAWLFRGQLRDIAVYDYPLEPERVLAHYEAGKPTG